MTKEEICECGHSLEAHIHYGFDGSRHSLNCKGCRCKKFIQKPKKEGLN